MLSDKRFGLSINLLATKVMPSLIPIIVLPSITLDEVSRNGLRITLMPNLFHSSTLWQIYCKKC